jgi:hypothetical protein
MDEDSAAAEVAAHDGDLLLYDYFKHLTSLVLITLGGLLLVMKDFDPKDARPKIVALTFLLVSTSGILSFAGAGEIVRSRYTGKVKHRTLMVIRHVAPVLLAGGLGMFIAMFLHRFTH